MAPIDLQRNFTSDYVASLTELSGIFNRRYPAMGKNNLGHNTDLYATIAGAESIEDIRAVPEEKI